MSIENIFSIARLQKREAIGCSIFSMIESNDDIQSKSISDNNTDAVGFSGICIVNVYSCVFVPDVSLVGNPSSFSFFITTDLRCGFTRPFGILTFLGNRTLSSDSSVSSQFSAYSTFFPVLYMQLLRRSASRGVNGFLFQTAFSLH
jgi:hypothetical protein